MDRKQVLVVMVIAIVAGTTWLSGSVSKLPADRAAVQCPNNGNIANGGKVEDAAHDLGKCPPCPEAICPEPEPCSDKAIACPTLPLTKPPPPPPPTPAPPVDDSLLPRNPPPHTDLADYKIYVYDDPVMAMEGLLDDCKKYSGRPDDDDFPRIHELMLRSPRRTMDPSEASLFFVNIPAFQSFVCKFAGISSAASTAKHVERMEAAVGTMKNTTWWQRYEGEDHLIATHNYRYTGGRRGSPIDYPFQPAFSRAAATRVDRYKNRKCFCGRAIISPYPTHPALNFTHATFNVWNNRTLTFYYQTRTTKSINYGSTILRHGPVFLPPSLPGHVERGKVEEAVWAARWQDAKFCLVIRGDSPTSHAFSNALLSSCIPVIMSDEWVDVGMPFREKIDINKFAVFIKEQDFFNKGNEIILKTIEGLSEESIRNKLDYMVNYAAPRLVAAHPTSLVGEMLIDEALERMYALPPGDTTA